MAVSDCAKAEANRLFESLGLPEGKLRIAMHIGAGNEAKQWDAEHFAALAQRLIDEEKRSDLVVRSRQ